MTDDDLTIRELVFKAYLEKAISKSRYGFIDLTNKQLAEKFSYDNKKYSVNTIRSLLEGGLAA